MTHTLMFIRFIKDELHWVTIEAFIVDNTPYERMKAVWLIIWPEVLYKETSGSSFRVLSDGQTYEFRNLHKDVLCVNMMRWKAISMDLCDRILPRAIEAMLPDSCLHLLNEFNTHEIHDNLIMDHAIHRQTQNIAWLEPLQGELQRMLLSRSERKHCLVDPNALNALCFKNYKKWRVLEQDVLGCIAAIFVLTAGPCFRSFQFETLRFDGSPTQQPRNLYLLADGRFILANPPAKQLGSDIASTLLSFPTSVKRHLSFYFLVIRPVCIQLLAMAEIDIPLYSSVIWVNTVPASQRKRNRHNWKGNDLHRAVQKKTYKSLGFQLTLALARQISHAVLRDKLPSLFFRSETTLEAILSSFDNGPLRPLAVGVQFPPFPHMEPRMCFSLLLVSIIWQAALGLASLEPHCEAIVSGSHIFPTIEFEVFALHRARDVVQQAYSLNPVLSRQSMSHAKQLQETMPYLRGVTVRFFDALILVTVLSLFYFLACGTMRHVGQRTLGAGRYRPEVYHLQCFVWAHKASAKRNPTHWRHPC